MEHVEKRVQLMSPLVSIAHCRAILKRLSQALLFVVHGAGKCSCLVARVQCVANRAVQDLPGRRVEQIGFFSSGGELTVHSLIQDTMGDARAVARGPVFITLGKEDHDARL